MGSPDTAAESRSDVCLVVVPFGAIHFPPLGPAVLASACQARGLRINTLFASIHLAARLGYALYNELAHSSGRYLLGERVFRPYAYSETLDRTAGPVDILSASQEALLKQVRAHIPEFMADMVGKVLAQKPRIVGFSSSFQQNLAAIGLARMIKDVAPHIRIVMGGANVAGRMADGLAQSIPWIDHFFDGEADTAFPEFCEQLIANENSQFPRVIRCGQIRDMNRVATPDFTDFMATLREFRDQDCLPAELPYYLTSESSRGCWWGEKHHCTFCGLNGEGMAHRHKSAEHFLNELKHLKDRWGIATFNLTDNILPHEYHRELLPKLTAWEDKPRLFYEIKANLRDDQLEALRHAGIDRIQPGIESLSTEVLKLMRKGVTAHQNISLLRSCVSIGIRVAWIYLYGLPGERIEEHRAALALMPKLEHLQPPTSSSRLMIHRFSPYFNTPEHFGIKNVTPIAAYNGLYPNKKSTHDIAYQFDGEYSSTLLEDDATVAEIRHIIGIWQNRWRDPQKVPVLRIVDNGKNGILIADTRNMARNHLTRISAEQRAALDYFERPRDEHDIDPAFRGHVDFLLASDFIVLHEDKFISLVTRQRTGRRPIAGVKDEWDP